MAYLQINHFGTDTQKPGCWQPVAFKKQDFIFYGKAAVGFPIELKQKLLTPGTFK